jgi:hypothetical protein
MSFILKFLYCLNEHYFILEIVSSFSPSMCCIKIPKKKKKEIYSFMKKKQELTNTNSIIKSKNNIEKIRKPTKTMQTTWIVVLSK